ncbi:MAG TPA: triose-phosphate isomerase [Candidatus Limnocylindria bacterium]|nr:triose-phosphate isomerase [Candidatus Limnocylindria bacterium]
MSAKLVVGNWKMNPGTVAEAVALARAVAAIDAGPVEVGVAPPAVWLAAVAEALRGRSTRVLAQDVHWEAKGAYTGQLAAPMAAALASGTIVGHSEVRRDQGDDDARVARKLLAALAAGLDVVACVGESEAEFDAGLTLDVIRRQVLALVAPLHGWRGSGRLRAIAYEPIWAIGTGRPATGAHASAAARAVRDAARGPADLLVLYGGSVSASSVAEFARAEGIDGALVGGASLKGDEFAAIVKAFR